MSMWCVDIYIIKLMLKCSPNNELKSPQEAQTKFTFLFNAMRQHLAIIILCKFKTWFAKAGNL